MKTKISILVSLFIVISSCSTTKTVNNSHEFTHPSWSYNTSIYEVNIRQYTSEGTFAAFEKHLQRIKDLGTDIIWLMPIHPIGEKNRKGTLGSYYSVKDYKDVNPDFGTKEDFKHLIEEAHKLNMHVIIDWVANHTAWDNNWTITNPEFYTKDSLGNFIPPVADWSDVIDLNYDNEGLRNAMLDALKYWVEEFDIDGYRCDVASMVPLYFWKNARNELDKIKPVFMLAEGNEPELHENGFDMTYNWQLKDVLNNFALGKANITDIKNNFLIENKKYTINSFRMNFTSNHDENTWAGTVYERLGKLAEPLAVLVSTAKGMPLVYSGQEAGLNKRLEFFEKDIIDWKENNLRNVYTKILNEKETNKAMRNGIEGGEMNFIDLNENKNVLTFTRELDDDKILVIINLSDKETDISISSFNILGEYKNILNDENFMLKENQNIKLGAYEYLVLVK